jgi:hypothetical protein
MSEKKTQTIVIDDVEHNLDDMTNEQKMLVNHCLDLDRKISSTQFNLDQLKVGKQAFVQLLKQALETKEETVTE